MDGAALLLTTAFYHTINESNVEAGYERFANLTGREIGFDAFCDAVAGCVRDGLIREPIRLQEGALQCHWHLELTPTGVSAARELLGIGASKQSIQESNISC
jgi:hypothetical protein